MIIRIKLNKIQDNRLGIKNLRRIPIFSSWFLRIVEVTDSDDLDNLVHIGQLSYDCTTHKHSGMNNEFERSDYCCSGRIESLAVFKADFQFDIP